MSLVPILNRPFARPGHIADQPWTLVWHPEDDVSAAVAAGARGGLVTATRDFNGLGHLASALAVAEAEAGLPAGCLDVAVLVVGAAALCRLPWPMAPTARLAAIGLGPAAAGPGAERLVAEGLIGLTARASGLAAFAADTDTPLGQPRLDGEAGGLPRLILTGGARR